MSEEIGSKKKRKIVNEKHYVHSPCRKYLTVGEIDVQTRARRKRKKIKPNKRVPQSSRVRGKGTAR